MIIDKKRVFLYSSILLLILVGVYFVNGFGAITRSTSFVTTSSTGAQVSGVNYTELANWTKGGLTENINFTIVLRSAAGLNGSAQINVTLPGGFTFPAAMLSNNVGATNYTNSTADPYPQVTLSNTSNVFSVTTTNNSNINGNSKQGNYSAGLTVNVFFNITAVDNGTEGVLNWTITSRDNSSNNAVDSGFGVLMGIDGLAPRASSHNVTDAVNTRTSFSSTQYLLYDNTKPQQGVNITLTLNDYNIDRVLLVYNNTGGSINFEMLRSLLYNATFLSNYSNTNSSSFGRNVNFTVLENTQNGSKANLTTLATRSDVRDTTARGYVFSFNISNNTWGEGATDGTLFKYVFVVYDLYNNSEIINNSNAEYVLARDAANPTVTLTAPSDTTITVSNSIKYTCNGADGSGVASCSLKLTKPGGTTVTKTGCGTEQTFTLTDTNEAGTNTVQCTLTDNVGHTASTSKTFSVSAATTGGAGAGGGGGGGGAGSTPENPVTVQQGESVDAGTLTTTETYTSVAKEGTVTFTVAGSSHSAKVLDVTTDSVTIEISSTPQQLTLTIGETKEVDLTDDDKNDLSVTLKSITDGKADLVFKSLEVVAPPAEEEKPGVVTGEAAKPTYTWLWIVLIVIVVVLVIWYLSRKKQ